MRRRRSLHYSAYTLPICKKRRRKLMPRYLIERTFPAGLKLSNDDESAALCAAIVFNNAEENVTWIHSYVSNDRRKTFCIYDAPPPETICQLTASRKSACSIPISSTNQTKQRSES